MSQQTTRPVRRRQRLKQPAHAGAQAGQGRFGVDRPDAASGAAWCCARRRHVKAVAPGTVVYAEWLRGFGNLIIVDHGQQYLTVYAYNQSLLKRVGDPVGGGDTIALVGATGGKWNPAILKFAIVALLSTRPSGWRSRSVPVQYIIGSHSLVHP